MLRIRYTFALSYNENNSMNWNELRKKAVENGFELLKHGGRHDIYVNKKTGKIILIERHWTQEVRTGLMNKLKREIGF